MQYLREQAAQVPCDRGGGSAAPAGSEDATLMMARVQERGGLASYMIFGTELSAGHHNEKFDFDEGVMTIAVETLARIALNFPAARCVMEKIINLLMTSLNRDATIFALLPMISGIIRKPDSEFWSAARLADALEAEGFQLSRHAGGIPNAFIASFGEGKPVIALLGEFDALAGLSQQAHSAEPTYATPGKMATAVGIIYLAPQRSPLLSLRNSGCSSMAARAPCALWLPG